MSSERACLGLVLVLMQGVAAVAVADSPATTTERPDESAALNFPASFFLKYEPDTALDMVELVPGFQINDGADMRGFGSAAGNVLIDGRRPSAKQDLPSAILRRVPASIVARIDLIRGQLRDIDMQGHSVLANVVLYQDAPAAIRWDASIRKHTNVDPLRGEASISVAHKWRAVDYSAGISGFRATFGDKGTENLLDGPGTLVEVREDASAVINVTGNVFLQASTWLGSTLVSVNTSVGYTNRDELLVSHRVPQDPDATRRDEFFGDDVTTRKIEFGFDAERMLGQHFLFKGIALFNGSEQDTQNDQRVVLQDGTQPLFRLADSLTDTSETIARVEFGWTGWPGHTVQANLEGAFNVLDNALLRTDDTGAGPIAVDVPGSDTRVEERRFDLLLQDTWTAGSWTLNYGLGAETSEISQSGDANQKRNFFFLKPRMTATWSHERGRQTSLRLAREVAQLDFRDFVSAAIFLDDDLALGNPDLMPESTWVTELTHERRFGNVGVVSITAFHDWIADVQDLLPISAEFEVPGNIGDGRRWGVEVRSTIPLDWTRLPGARLDVKLRWQSSSVTDPVTGEERVLSAEGGFTGVPTELPFRNENDYAYAVNYRQDFQRSKFAWGWSVSERGERPRFKANELDTYDEKEPVIDLFIETTRWLGIKVGFEINNLLDLTASRDRLIYSGRRGMSDVARRELRGYSLGRRYTLAASGSF